MVRKVLITGVSGFVGINLAEYLLKKGYVVIGMDLSDRHDRLKMSLILNCEKFIFKKINLANSKIVSDDFLDDIQAIFHLAALPHVDYSRFYPHQTITNNIETLLNTIELAGILKVPIIFASSVEIYGGDKNRIYKEEALPTAFSPYASSKVAGEAIIKAYIETQGLKGTIFRFTNLYGSWQAPDRLIPRVIAQILLENEVTVESGTIRDFVYIEDACEILERSINFDHTGEIYNLSSGIGIDNLSVARIISGYLPSSKIEIIEPRNNDGRGRYLVSDPKKIFQLSGWRANTRLEQGILDTVSWYKNHSDWLSKFTQNLGVGRNSTQFLTDAISELPS